MEYCKVCGMEVEISESAESTVYKNKTYYFCTNLCNILFIEEPEKYISTAKNRKNKK